MESHGASKSTSAFQSAWEGDGGRECWAAGDVLTPLPLLRDEVWTPGSAIPTGEFSLGVCAGSAREGDIASWCVLLTRERPGGPHWHRRVDLKVGGYAHNYVDPTVNTQLCRHAACAALVFLQLQCGAWSAVRFRKDGLATPLFTAQHPKGVVDSRGAVAPQAARARECLRMGLLIARACLSKGGEVLFEHPVSQGSASHFASKGREDHVTLYDHLSSTLPVSHPPLLLPRDTEKLSRQRYTVEHST